MPVSAFSSLPVMDGKADQMNGAGFLDAACVAYYAEIRRGVTASAAGIGYGVNRTPPARVVLDWLTTLYSRALADRVTDYVDTHDAAERALIAELASRHLGIGDIGHEHVVLCAGTTEGISIITGFAGLHRMNVVLPVPLYCSFEQSAARSGVPVAAYYSDRGVTAERHIAEGPLLLVDIAPNGVSGGWFDLPPVFGSVSAPSLRVVDHVFSVPTFHNPREFQAELQFRANASDLADTIILLTPSKDLSLPGLRCGAFITKNESVLAYASADRFERGYSLPIGLGRVVAAHLALLLLAFASPAERPALHRELEYRFGSAGLTFLSAEDGVAFIAHLQESRSRFLANLDLVDRSGILLPVGGNLSPVAGYSAFRQVAATFGSAEEFTRWVNLCGRRGLKLSPNYVFGADPTSWAEMYPGCYGIRVNISVSRGELEHSLSLLKPMLPA